MWYESKRFFGTWPFSPILSHDIETNKNESNNTNVFKNVTPCSPLKGKRLLGGTYHPHIGVEE